MTDHAGQTLANPLNLSTVDDPWSAYTPPPGDRERLWGKNRTFLGDVWFRFRRRTSALFGLVLISLCLAFALLGPLCTPFSYRDQNLAFVNIPPCFMLTEDEGGFLYVTANLKPIEVDRNGKLLRALSLLATDDAAKRIRFDFRGEEFILDYQIKPYRITRTDGTNVGRRIFAWNRTFLLGSDSLGRDMMTRLMYGARVSLLVALTAALTNLLIGVLFGSVSAYFGGIVDAIMMRIVDIISTLPLTLYVILIMVFLGSGLSSIIIALGTVYWVNMARVVRGEILSLKGRDFVLASRTIGSSTWTILTRHLIPNAMGPILVTLTMLIPQAIFMEAFLSFIGLGIAPPLASLGTMCSDALATLRTSPYQLFEPALLICVLMFGFNFVGDGLRDALDPKLRR